MAEFVVWRASPIRMAIRVWQHCKLAAALCGLALVLSACGARVDLITGVSEPEANEVLASLLDAGLDATKAIGKNGATITVSSAQVARALDTLKANGLPREQFAGMGQIFRKEGLVSSPVEEQARYIYALSQELANTLSQIDGVLAARVHVVLPERGEIGEQSRPSTAAVFIKHRPGYTIDVLKPQIKQLVTHSIPGLNEDRVSVVLVSAQPGAAASGAQAPALSSVFGVPVAIGAANEARILIGGLALLFLLALASSAWLAWRYVRPALRSKAS